MREKIPLDLNPGLSGIIQSAASNIWIQGVITMEKAKVYYTDFRTVAFGDGLPTMLKKLIKKAGIGKMDMDGKFVAIKMHFGEPGNLAYLRNSTR